MKIYENNEEDNLRFRALIIPDKSKLRHSAYNHDHNTWYYKMYFEMLKVLFTPNDRYRIYLDIKDTRSGNKVVKLHDVICNSNYDFQRRIIETVLGSDLTSGDSGVNALKSNRLTKRSFAVFQIFSWLFLLKFYGANCEMIFKS